MKTINEPLTSPEEKSSRTTLLFTAMALAALMVSAVVGGAAFMIYHQFSSMPNGTQASTSRGPQTVRLSRLTPSQDRWTDTAESSDRSDYRRVDNTVLAPAAARRVIAAWKSNPVVANVPPPLMKTADETTQESANRPPLTDPESRYIVSARTGQVVGVDGSVGAAAEAWEQRAIPVAAPVQMPAPEVRVASPVQVRAALPVTPGEEDTTDLQTTGYTDGSQYVPVRRAQPATTGRSFNAASYLAADNNLPVVRGQVVNPISRAAGYRQDFRLPDTGSRY